MLHCTGLQHGQEDFQQERKLSRSIPLLVVILT